MIQPKWDNLAESTQLAANRASSKEQQLQEAYSAGYQQALNEVYWKRRYVRGYKERLWERQNPDGTVTIFDSDMNELGTYDPSTNQSTPYKAPRPYKSPDPVMTPRPQH